MIRPLDDNRMTYEQERKKGSFPRRVLSALRSLVDLEQQGLTRSIEEVSVYASGELLDVGCGDKPYEPVLGPNVSSYVGLEYSDTYEGTVNEAKGKADVVYYGDSFPFTNGSFDTVLCTQVLEHVPDPKSLVNEMARVLRPGGHLIVTVPFSYRLHSEPYDYWRFTKHGLALLIESAGLSLEYISDRGGFWKVIGQSLCSYLGFRVAKMERIVQDIGGFSYEAASIERPRYWVLPVIAPLILLTAIAARILDMLFKDESVVLGYLAVASKPLLTDRDPG